MAKLLESRMSHNIKNSNTRFYSVSKLYITIVVQLRMQVHVLTRAI